MITKDSLKELKQIEIAALLGLSERRIQQLHAEGLPRNGEGRGGVYVWEEVRAWYEARISGSKPGEDRTDRQRKDAADADMAEMQASRMAGNLLDASEVKTVWNGFLGRLKTNLDGLPDRVADRLEDGMNLAERASVIRSELNSIRRELVEGVRSEAGEENP